MHRRKLIRDFQKLLRTIESFTDRQARVVGWDDAEITWFTVEIRPNDGLYKGGAFLFKVYLEGSYPATAPRVDCLTPIYHPNIDTTTSDYNICLNLLEDWQESFDFETLVQGLMFLLYNPNLEDPLSPYFDGDSQDEEVFRENVARSLQGLSSDEFGEEFPENNTESFTEEELNKGISLILEAAVEWAAAIPDDQEEVATPCDENDNYLPDDAGNPGLMRSDSKLDKVDCDEECGPARRDDLGKSYLWRFMPSWESAVATVVQTCVNILADR